MQTPLRGIYFDRVKTGSRVSGNSGALMMARGGITIEDDVMIAAGVSLLTNNRDVLLCSTIRIGQGAGATVLPGVSICRLSVAGAAAVVTHDVPDYAVVAGNPARIVRMSDPEKFTQLS